MKNRTDRLIKNSTSAVIASLVTVIVGFIAQKIFVSTLGLEYLGVNNVFGNVLTILGLAELGLGAAIIYHLYEPIVMNKRSEVRSLLRFYRNSYRIIAGAVAALGIMILPLVSSIIGPNSIRENLYVIFGLFLLDVVFSYLLVYKRSLLYANQKNYIINYIHVGYTILMNGLQIYILLLYGNFYAYLVTKVALRLLENIVINIIVGRLYPYVFEGTPKPLSLKLKSDIIKKIKGLFFHKIGGFVVTGTDSIVISVFLGVSVVGLYGNYLVVLTSIILLIEQLNAAIISSIGNLLVTSDSAKNYQVYRKLRLANLFLSVIVTSLFFTNMSIFVRIWLGEEYVLGLGVLAALSAQLYLTIYRSPIYSFKIGAGIFYQDRYVPILEAFINLVFSVILVQVIGLAGVFVGTILSSLIVHLYSNPVYVYTKLFNKAYSVYYREFVSHIFIASGVAGLSFVTVGLLPDQSAISRLLLGAVITCFIATIVFYAIFRKSFEIKFYVTLLRNNLNLR